MHDQGSQMRISLPSRAIPTESNSDASHTLDGHSVGSIIQSDLFARAVSVNSNREITRRQESSQESRRSLEWEMISPFSPEDQTHQGEAIDRLYFCDPFLFAIPRLGGWKCK